MRNLLESNANKKGGPQFDGPITCEEAAADDAWEKAQRAFGDAIARLESSRNDCVRRNSGRLRKQLALMAACGRYR